MDKLTPWFPVQTNPAREGVYEVQTGQPARYKRYSYWNGSQWGFREGSVEQAFLYRANEAYGPILSWRGLRRPSTTGRREESK